MWIFGNGEMEVRFKMRKEKCEGKKVKELNTAKTWKNCTNMRI